MKPFPISCYTFAALSLVAGCGGGGGAATDPIVPPDPVIAAFDTLSETRSATLTLAVVDREAGVTSLDGGTLNRDSGTATIGSLSGTFDVDEDSSDALSFVFSDGPNEGAGVDIVFDDNKYAGRITTADTVDYMRSGIIGIETPISQMPEGSARYVGRSRITILDNSDLYRLSGDARLDVVFDDEQGSVRTSIVNIGGQLLSSEGQSVTVSVQDIARITFRSELSGNTFTDGDFNFSSDSLSEVTEDADFSLAGAFYGPDAAEAGVAFVIGDTAFNELSIFGSVLAIETEEITDGL